MRINISRDKSCCSYKMDHDDGTSIGGPTAASLKHGAGMH